MNEQQMRDDLARQVFNMSLAGNVNEYYQRTEDEIGMYLKFIAKLSYRAADAMMAERAK